MRPYLAILVDSFREALHSRVLWVVLICISLFFVIIAPASLKEHTTTGLQDYDILSTTDLARRLIEAGTEEGGQPSPARYVWQQLDKDLHRRLPKLVEERTGEQGLEDLVEAGEIKKDLLQSLDKQIKDPDWNEAEPLQKVRLRREGRPLAEKQKKGEKLTDDERKRLNRLVLEAIFPESIAVSPAKSTTLAYFYFFDSGQQLPFSREDVKGFLPTLVVQIMDWLFGIFGILAAMLVTASIIPQMFEPGSLHLLLSKPVSRSGLFLTKFLGGCAFAMLSSAYFAIGLWLIVGTRFGVWDSRLLAAVPAYTFVFAIYYSVTALAGLVFRNTIVAIVMGMLFWAVCFFVGSVKVWGVDPFVMEVNRVRRVVPADDTVIAVAPLVVSQWDGEQHEWRQIYKSQEEGPDFFSQTFPVLGPFYDAEHDQLVSVQRSAGLGSDVTVSVAPRSQLWPRSRGMALPAGAVAMFPDRQSRFVVVTLEGIYRSKRNVAQSGGGSKVLGFSLPWSSAGGFEKISEENWPHVSQPLTAALDPQSDAVAIYSRGRVSVWKAGKDGKFVEHATREFGEDEEKTEMLVAIAGKRVLLAPTDGRLLALDTDTLKTETEFKTELDKPVRQLRASPDGRRIAVLLSHGRLWMFDPSSDKYSRADVSHQGTISAVAYDSSGRLLFAHDVNRVSRWDEEKDSLELLCRPKLTPTETVAYYVAIPLYNILPKPGEVDRTVIHLMTGKKATNQADANRSGDVQFTPYVDPWQPVWSSALFMAVMLGIGCAYMERMEF